MDRMDPTSSVLHSPKTIWVTGAGGQLGRELQEISKRYPSYLFIFTSHQDLAIEDPIALNAFFSNHHIDYCINCAAYTAVDKAESEPEKAFLINATAPGLLARACKKNEVKLIHISTDYVYEGSLRRPLREDDPVGGHLNVYGASKLEGEKQVLSFDPDAVIIRTSWVYSSFGSNFVKTMLRLFAEKKSLNVVNDQTGSPTYAADLALVLMNFVVFFEMGNSFCGILNYCNSGETTWYDFACAIKNMTLGSDCEIHPISTLQYPTPAKRPAYSVLETSQIRNLLNLEIPFWKDSLAKCLKILH